MVFSLAGVARFGDDAAHGAVADAGEEDVVGRDLAHRAQECAVDTMGDRPTAGQQPCWVEGTKARLGEVELTVEGGDLARHPGANDMRRTIEPCRALGEVLARRPRRPVTAAVEPLLGAGRRVGGLAGEVTVAPMELAKWTTSTFSAGIPKNCTRSFFVHSEMARIWWAFWANLRLRSEVRSARLKYSGYISWIMSYTVKTKGLLPMWGKK